MAQEVFLLALYTFSMGRALFLYGGRPRFPETNDHSRHIVRGSLCFGLVEQLVAYRDRLLALSEMLGHKLRQLLVPKDVRNAVAY